MQSQGSLSLVACLLQGVRAIVCVESHCYAYIKPQEMFQRSGQVNIVTFLLPNMQWCGPGAVRIRLILDFHIRIRPYKNLSKIIEK